MPALLALLSLPGDPAVADFWNAPEPEHWSANGKYVLKIDWGSDVPDRLSLWRNTPLGLLPRWSRGYVDETWPPRAAYVTNDGQHVVLCNPHGSGYGDKERLVFLGPRGEILRAHVLRDFLTDDEILRHSPAFSSKRWSHPAWFAFRDGARQFALVSSAGTVCCFDTATGARLELKEPLRSQIVAEASAYARRLLSHSDAWLRADGASLLGVLGVEDSVPDLKTALRDNGVTGDVRIGDAKPESIYGVKLAAAEALVRLMGGRAMPLIEPEFETDNYNSRQELLAIVSGDSIESGDIPALKRWPIPRESWERLARSKADEVRSCALKKLLTTDDGTYARRHPELLDCNLDGVRWWAVRAFAEHPTIEDLPRFRQLLLDPDDVVQTWAWRALVRLNPPDVHELLVWATRQKDEGLYFEAKAELLRRRDADTLAWLSDYLNALAEDTLECKVWGLEEMWTGDILRAVAERQLREAEAGLRAALKNDCVYIQIPVCGALAALGDADARLRLREFARRGQPECRASAIEWLAIVNDTASMAYLDEATHDREPRVREAAEEALAKLRPAKP